MRERTPDDFEHAKAVTHIIGLNMGLRRLHRHNGARSRISLPRLGNHPLAHGVRRRMTKRPAPTGGGRSASGSGGSEVLKSPLFRDDGWAGG